MATCPDCEFEDVDTEDLEEGDSLSCPECGRKLVMNGLGELDFADPDDDLDDDEEDDEDEDDEDEDDDDDDDVDDDDEETEESQKSAHAGIIARVPVSQQRELGPEIRLFQLRNWLLNFSFSRHTNSIRSVSTSRR